MKMKMKPKGKTMAKAKGKMPTFMMKGKKPKGKAGC